MRHNTGMKSVVFCFLLGLPLACGRSPPLNSMRI